VKYQVEWIPAALQELARTWTAPRNRNAVTAASHAINQTLEDDPDTVGRVVFDSVRVYTYPPLGVESDLIPADLRVWVLSVWDTGAGRPSTAGN
jgi:hypothetical protein